MDEQLNPVEVSELPKIKLIKLVNGESIVAMVELGKGDFESEVTLYNPFKIVYGDLQGSPMKGVKVPFMIEEWLPSSIVQEQMCVILQDDILTMVDVNEGFLRSYTTSVLKKVGIEELIRKGELFEGDKTFNDMRETEEEEDERNAEEFGEQLAGKLSNFRKKFN